MNRLEWILGILLVLLLIVVAVLSVLFWFQPEAPVAQGPSQSATIIAQRAAQIEPTPDLVGQTAVVAYAAAQQRAAAWQPDAELLNATATWPQGASADALLSGQTTWGFTFFSPTAREVASISVVENEATFVSSAAAPEMERPLSTSAWNVDSDDAIQILLREGGANFLQSEDVTVLTMGLLADNQNQADRLEWIVSLISTINDRALQLRLNATTGEVIDVQELP